MLSVVMALAVVMNVSESHPLGESCKPEDSEGSCRLSVGPAYGAAMRV
jgi:hypothetical protein